MQLNLLKLKEKDTILKSKSGWHIHYDKGMLNEKGRYKEK